MNSTRDVSGNLSYVGIDFGVNADDLDSAGMPKYCSIVVCQAVREESGRYYLRLKYANKLKVTEVYDLIERKKFPRFALMYIDRTFNLPAAGSIERTLKLDAKHYREFSWKNEDLDLKQMKKRYQFDAIDYLRQHCRLPPIRASMPDAMKNLIRILRDLQKGKEITDVRDDRLVFTNDPKDADMFDAFALSILAAVDSITNTIGKRNKGRGWYRKTEHYIETIDPDTGRFHHNRQGAAELINLSPKTGLPEEPVQVIEPDKSRLFFMGVEFGVNADQAAPDGSSRYAVVVVMEAVKTPEGGYRLFPAFAKKVRASKIYESIPSFVYSKLIYIDDTFNRSAAKTLKTKIGSDSRIEWFTFDETGQDPRLRNIKIRNKKDAIKLLRYVGLPDTSKLRGAAMKNLVYILQEFRQSPPTWHMISDEFIVANLPELEMFYAAVLSILAFSDFINDEVKFRNKGRYWTPPKRHRYHSGYVDVVRI